MTWYYSQTSGLLRHDEEKVGTGYSGHGTGLNNHLAEFEHNHGPIPCGRYRIGTPGDSIDHGPYVIPLAPSMSNQMAGRNGFLIHGDRVGHVGEHLASEGCIVLARNIRERIVESEDRDLIVCE
jgi:hypothetical protein